MDEIQWLDHLLDNLDEWNREARSSVVVSMLREEIIYRLNELESGRDA